MADYIFVTNKNSMVWSLQNFTISLYGLAVLQFFWLDFMAYILSFKIDLYFKTLKKFLVVQNI